MEGYKRPAQGLTPERIWKMGRIDEIKLAISRRIENGDTVDPEWVEEYNRLKEEVYESRVSEKYKESRLLTKTKMLEEKLRCVRSLVSPSLDDDEDLGRTEKRNIIAIIDRPL